MHSAMLITQMLKKITNHSNFQSSLVIHKSIFFLFCCFGLFLFKYVYFLFSGYMLLLMDSMCRPVGFSAQSSTVAHFSGHAMFPQSCQFSFYTYKEISFSCVILPSSCPLIHKVIISKVK